MAQPIQLTDATNRFRPKLGEPYDIHIRDYQLGKKKTIEALSCWAFGPDELKEVLETGLVFLRVFGGQPPVCIFHGEITEFEGQNAIFRLDDCNDLPALVREITYGGVTLDEITSAWRLNTTGIDELKRNGYIILSVVGGMTDVEIFGINPNI